MQQLQGLGFEVDLRLQVESTVQDGWLGRCDCWSKPGSNCGRPNAHQHSCTVSSSTVTSAAFTIPHSFLWALRPAAAHSSPESDPNR